MSENELLENYVNEVIKVDLMRLFEGWSLDKRMQYAKECAERDGANGFCVGYMRNIMSDMQKMSYSTTEILCAVQESRQTFSPTDEYYWIGEFGCALHSAQTEQEIPYTSPYELATWCVDKGVDNIPANLEIEDIMKTGESVEHNLRMCLNWKL